MRRLKEKDVDDVEEAKNGRRDSDKNTYDIFSQISSIQISWKSMCGFLI